MRCLTNHIECECLRNHLHFKDARRPIPRRNWAVCLLCQKILPSLSFLFCAESLGPCKMPVLQQYFLTKKTFTTFTCNPIPLLSENLTIHTIREANINRLEPYTYLEVWFDDHISDYLIITWPTGTASVAG